MSRLSFGQFCRVGCPFSILHHSNAYTGNEPQVMRNILAIYAESNRRKNLLIAAFLIVAIAIVDWKTLPYLSFGFLYLFPIMLVAGFLKRWQIVGVSLLCSALQELFSGLPITAAVIPRLAMVTAGYIGNGFFFFEVASKRRLATEPVDGLEREVRVRSDAVPQHLSL